MPAFFLYLWISFLLPAHPSEQVTLVKHLEGKANAIASDDLQNLYVVKNEVIEKYDANGKFLFSYSDKTLGPVDGVDPADPMKTLVFYKTFAQFVILDNTLTTSGDPVPMQNYGYEQVNLACTSYDRGYWFYNPANMELIHLTADDLVMNKSTGNIGQLMGVALHPNYLLEQSNKVFLNDPQLGILVFDVYGAYFKTLPLKGLPQFQVSGEKIIYLEGKKIKTYNYKTLEEEVLPLPDTTALALRVEKERMFILTDKGVDLYSVH